MDERNESDFKVIRRLREILPEDDPLIKVINVTHSIGRKAALDQSVNISEIELIDFLKIEMQQKNNSPPVRHMI